MVRAVQVFPGGVHDLGYHMVWCPKYRHAVLAGFSVGAVSAVTVQRYIDTQYKRPWRKERGR
jgi:REP element-mobilizing transposase RayT